MSMKKALLLVACINATGVNAESNVNKLLVKYCSEQTHNTSQSVTIEDVTAIGYHRNGFLQIEQPVNDNALKLELAKRTEKLGLDSECMEYLDAIKLLSINASTDKHLLARVYFDFDRYSLTSESITILDKIVSQLKTSSDTVELIGHTDNMGSNEYNLTLGLLRGTSTKQYLIEQGVAGGSLNVISEGETKPLVNNSNKESREKNRRVDIY